ncbi:MAG: hypothetical protein E7667_06305 [Ruminococcaceae bacterium]|nr:hypothetical protein [Oscillospiraceae bacterium]
MKAVAGAICAALLIVALVFSPSVSADVVAGAGKGENAELTSLEDVADFFDFLNNGTDSSVYAPDFDFLSAMTEDGTDAATEIPIDAATEGNTEDQEPSHSEKSREKKTYTSGTIHEVSQMNAESSYHGDSYGGSSRYSMVRTLSIYLTEDASYYKSNGSLQSNSNSWSDVDGEYDEEGSATSMMWDFEFYFDEDQMLMKINNLVLCSDDEDFKFPFDREGFGKWLDISDTDVLGAIEIDAINRESLGELGECIVEYMDDGFVKNGKVYTLIDKFIEDSKIVVNLNDADSPVLEMTYSQSDDSSSGSYSSHVGAVYTFENINNTVVELSDDIKVEDAADYIDLED